MSNDVINKNIVSEMETSFLDYAMSVIVARALPDVRDGLKPVHRRILFAMSELGNTPDKPYKKSARIVGDVIGKYHPHGDSSVYEAMVRMAQEFSYRLELVDGHGNFGSMDGDGAAAMRYTEARMSKASQELLRDLQKKTVDYIENYDGTEKEPSVLPAKFPNLLVNGASGIAVGMATNIPPHNLGEVVDGCLALLGNENTTIDELRELIKGPDFPLGAQILGESGIKKAYETGNGSIKVRSKYEVVTLENGRERIVFTEIPFQVNKAATIEKIADNVKNKIIEGIADLRDESDRDGIRIVVELKREASSEVVLNQIFKFSQLETSFAINMLALVDGRPRVLNIKEVLYYYLEHQKDVIVRRTQFDLDKASKRAHILRGLKIATDNIDQVISIIRSSNTTEIARNRLMESFELSEEQTKAILDMRLQKLTGLEREKIETELHDLEILIKDLEDILANPARVRDIIKEDLIEVKSRFSTPRRTQINTNYIDINGDIESLIEEEEILITLTKEGYIKRLSPDLFRAQRRGGKGSKGLTLNDEDEVSEILITTTHSDLLFFTDSGKVFKTRAYKVPEYASKTAKGLPLINLIDLQKEDKVTKIISLKDYPENKSMFFVTKQAHAKRTSLDEFHRINKNGKIAMTISEEDSVVDVELVDDNDSIFIATSEGISLKTQSTQFRQMGRTAKGVRAIRFKTQTDYVVGFEIVKDDDLIISVTEHGYGKGTLASEYRFQARGGKGSRNLKVTEKTGSVKQITTINDSEKENYDLIIITQKGQSIRTNGSNLRALGRNTQGVRLINIDSTDSVSSLQIAEVEEKDENESEEKE